MGGRRIYPRNGDGCIEPGCDKPHHKAGRCCAHYFARRYKPKEMAKTGRRAAAWRWIEEYWKRWS